ncbi:MAG: hypothetical protein A2538_05055 [Candidatus Magasanikbacteria bacterium RIFOXYD2_FULL_41_14]|uniref:O-antigen ligase-related domain-containing protein n=1 Tax=Candidatus Magasanikbacteria bacterium RIFOXYD2_FULL_41_14 TaxID=1798709 RepID=A0A1F6PFS7_9BACT|nr:MAG: hypothetical protein A2538_05055 [Candidatus Magasanikbacteria bacterium RIFOXYD2_FULL_41_14]
MPQFNRRQFIFFLVIFGAIRLFSFWFSPQTPLFPEHWLNQFVALLYLAIVAYYLNKKNLVGWYLIACEIILGGGGGYFSINGVSLRTSLLITSILIFLLQNIKDLKLKINNYKTQFQIFNLQSSILLLFVIAIFSTIIGFVNKHNFGNIISDLIPYCFLFYYFPLKKLWADEKFKKTAFNLLVATIVGNFLIIIITFIGYSSGLMVLQDYFYHWFRDVAGGKITTLPFHYFRLTLNEHLLLVPILLLTLYKIITKQKSFWWLATPLLIILPFNLTRIYFLALVVGSLTLLRKHNLKIWLKTMAIAFVIFMSALTVFHYSASGGKSFGWELLGLRLQSIATPQIEDSSLSRMLLFPKIIEKIKSTPIFGTGLGDMVTVYSPVFKQEITTPHFDWGYLEIWAEMGFIGLLIWGLFIGNIFAKIQKKSFAISMLTALMVINLTSPALFHVLGIILLIAIICHCDPPEAEKQSLR